MGRYLQRHDLWARIVIIALPVVCIVFCLWLLERREKEQIVSDAHPIVSSSIKTLHESSALHIEKRISKKAKRMTAKRVERAAKKRSFVDDAVYEVALDDISVVDSIDARIKPISAWQVDPDKIKALSVGETLVIPLDGIEYPVKITKKESVRRSTIITGIYEDEGVRYPTIISIGGKTIFVTFQSPKGGYQSALEPSEGYVYSNASIEEAWVDKSKSDAL